MLFRSYRIKETDTKDFWLPILQQKSFYDFVKNKYSIGQVDMITDEAIDKELAELDHEE